MLFVCHLLDNKTNWLSSASHISRISRPVWISCHADQFTCYTWYRPAADEPKTRARYKKRITWKTWPAARFSLHFQCHRRTFAAFGDEAAPGFLSKGLVPVISPAFFRETGDSHNKIHVNKASNRWVEEQRELGAFLCHVRLNVHETVRTLTLIASLSLVRRHHLALRAGYCYGERLPMICVTVFVSRITWHPSPVILPFTSRTFVLMAIYYLRRFSREFACCQIMMMKIRRHSCCIIMSFTVEFAEVIP